MKNSTELFLSQWQENKQQQQQLVEQLDGLFADLMKQYALLEQMATVRNDFFPKDDYVRIVIEIKAYERIGEQWPGRWSNLTMLADMLTPIVGWLVSPNSLSRAFSNIARYKDEITRRAEDLRKKNAPKVEKK